MENQRAAVREGDDESGFDAKEDKRLSERLAGPMKAGKVLKLVFD